MKDPLVERLTGWTVLAVWIVVTTLISSLVIWVLVAIWRRILGY